MRERGLKLEPCIELILVRKYQLLGPFTRHRIPCDHSKPKGSVCSKLNGTVQKGDMQECVESEYIQCEMWECHSECKPLSDSEIDKF